MIYKKSFFVKIVVSACLFGLTFFARGEDAPSAAVTSPDPRFAIGELLAQDDFHKSLDLWKWELEKGGSVLARDGSLEIDVPGGCTVWHKSPLSGPLLICYEATVVGAGGPNDRVSDLNCFWMARDARSFDNIFGTPRSGKFSDYDRRQCYHVGQGGNANTTTRFRRYIGGERKSSLTPRT